MSEWIQVNQKELNVPRTETRNGVEVQVFVSPYDIPEAVRGAYDKRVNRFAIEFKYLADEEPTVEQIDGDMRLFVGKTSNRLHRIEIDVDRLDADCVYLHIFKGIERLVQLQKKPYRQGNYRTAERIIQGRRSELFSSLATN